MTIATGDMSEAEADRLGLVPTHAYAVLELREINGMRMVQAKNPYVGVGGTPCLPGVWVAGVRAYVGCGWNEIFDNYDLLRLALVTSNKKVGASAMEGAVLPP